MNDEEKEKVVKMLSNMLQAMVNSKRIFFNNLNEHGESVGFNPAIMSNFFLMGKSLFSLYEIFIEIFTVALQHLGFEAYHYTIPHDEAKRGFH